MRSVRASGIVLALGIASFVSAGVLMACASIIGVEDVRPRKDGGVGKDDVDPEPEIEADIPDTTVMPPPQENILEVALGLQHTCARKKDFTVKCWGDDSTGQTGTGGMADGGMIATPQAVAINDAIRISAGQLHTCIVHKPGTVSCWGQNQDGQLGNGQSNTTSPVPVDVTGVTDAIGISCGASFSCALRRSGGVACWGNGLGGQLGTDNPQLQPVQAPVSGLTDAVFISAGESHTCAVKSAGTVVCWGDNTNGQLGTGDKVSHNRPTPVQTLTNIAFVAAGSRSTCALDKAGAVFCWGANEIGQLGSGAANASPNPSPTVVSGVDAIKLWAGKDHACAVKKGGAVVCWGAGFQGQIGDGQPRAMASTPTPTPSTVSGITAAIGVGTGGNHSCAPTSTDLILCWGDNTHGEIGRGTFGGQLLSPESVLTYP
jgi:alpha-tubulin suppressor-like RCC1 family protein